ncbi:hypothetical protein PRIPAC_90671 [Pristionchus pacificus]|uniref:Uncharacterized protein n=1 Tax=Pristionchus pacificus TaxID=54126 RepID=A0A2A6B8Q4_PRIPA|nr:hypothetical protein PRIPAC_90671 [Pristionchus pacificus]|eukprot:PDM62259.1 hypothetical protein PRIPAC_51701 [Pristionchus pacificus]
MRCLLVLLAFITTVYSSSYTPVETPPTRERLQGPLDVDDKEQCELACDCARGEPNMFSHPAILVLL